MLFLGLCLFAVVLGAAFIGWVVRMNVESGDETPDPRELARNDATESQIQ